MDASALSNLCAKLKRPLKIDCIRSTISGYYCVVKVGKEVISTTAQNAVIFKTKESSIHFTTSAALVFLQSDANQESETVSRFIRICENRSDVNEFRTKFEVQENGLRRVYVCIFGNYYGGRRLFTSFSEARIDALEEAYFLLMSSSLLIDEPVAHGDSYRPSSRAHSSRSPKSKQSTNTSTRSPENKGKKANSSNDNTPNSSSPKHFRSKITPIAWKSLESYCKDRNLRLHKPVIRKNRNQTTVEIMVNRETFSIPTESYKTEKLGIELTSLFILELLKDDEKSSAEDVCFVFSAMCEKNIYTAATKQADSSLFGKGVTLSLKEKFTGVGYPSYAMARKEAITAALIELDKKGNFRKSFCQSIERPFRPLVYPLTVQSVLPSSKDTPTFKFLEAFSDRMQFIISYSYAVDERDKFCSAIRLQYSHHVVPDVTVYGQNTFDSKELARESVEAVVYRGVNGLLVKNILSELSRLSNSDALWLKCVPLNEATKKRSLSELGGLSEGNDKRLKSVEESEQVDISDESDKNLIGAEESNQSIGELDENGRFDDDLEMLGSDMTSNSVETSSLHNFSDDAPELGAQSDATTSLNNSPAYVPEKSEIDSPSSIRGNSPEPKIELEPWSTPKRNDEQGSDEMLDNISVKSEPKSLDDDHIMIISHTIPRPHFEVAKSSSLHATPSPNNNQISTTSSLTLLPTNYIPNMNHFPLHYACAICDFDSILQLANNETIRQPDLHGRFPLHYFCAACDLNSAIIEQVVWKLAGLSDTNEITTLEILSKQDNNYLTPLAISLAVDARVALEMKRKRNKLDRVLTDFRQNLPKVYASTITQILSEMQPSLNSYHPGSRRTCFHGLVLQVGKRLKEKSFDDVGLLASELVFVILNWFRNGLDLFLEDVRKESGWSLLNRLSAETSETKFRQVWEKLKDIEKWVEEQRMLTQ